eukprot:1161900-Pelagomonas_calceolata.AAC.5
MLVGAPFHTQQLSTGCVPVGAQRGCDSKHRATSPHHRSKKVVECQAHHHSSCRKTSVVRGMEKTIQHLVKELQQISIPIRTDRDMLSVASVAAGNLLVIALGSAKWHRVDRQWECESDPDLARASYHGALQLSFICAMVRAGNNPEVGKLISDAMVKVGRQGVVTMEESRTAEDNLFFVEGMQFDRGYYSPYFVTDPERMVSVHTGKHVRVLPQFVRSVAALPCKVTQHRTDPALVDGVSRVPRCSVMSTGRPQLRMSSKILLEYAVRQQTLINSPVHRDAPHINVDLTIFQQVIQGLLTACEGLNILSSTHATLTQGGLCEDEISNILLMDNKHQH